MWRVGRLTEGAENTVGIYSSKIAGGMRDGLSGYLS